MEAGPLEEIVQRNVHMKSLETRLLESIMADLPRRVAVEMRDYLSQAFTVANLKAVEEADLGAKKVDAQVILADLWNSISKSERMYVVPLSTTDLDVLRNALDIISTGPQNNLLDIKKEYLDDLRNRLDNVRSSEETNREPEER